jgi:hypothetical protein
MIAHYATGGAISSAELLAAPGVSVVRTQLREVMYDISLPASGGRAALPVTVRCQGAR